MRRQALTTTIILAALLLAVPAATLGADPPPALQSQAGMTFVNQEAGEAHGLHVTLSGKAEVLANPENGRVGPFRDVQSNGSNHVILFNPVEPVAGGGAGKIDLIFRSYDKKLRITGWWWTDAEGKLIGEKQKPPK
jgi:hypothetical protein